MKSTGSATIDQLQCCYLVPAEHPTPDEVRSRLDGVAHDHLAGTCSRWLEQLLDPRDPSIWLIRQLNIDLSVDVGTMDDNKLAGIWGRQIALCIAHALAASADAGSIHLAEPGGSWSEELQPVPRAAYVTGPDMDGDIVRRYASQAIYVAHFIADLAEGRAWGKWYYRLFDSVSNLTNSAAIRAVITREPESIEEILMYLVAQHRLEPVLRCLNEHDSRDIFEQLVPARGTEDNRQDLIELALSAWPSATLLLFSERIATAQNALRLYITMRQIAPGHVSGNMRTIVENLLRFAEILRNVTRPMKLIEYLIANDLTGAIQLLHAADGISSKGRTLSLYVESLSFLQQVTLGEEAFLYRVASTVASTKILALGQGEADSMVLSTPAGGIFLLLPSLLDLKLHELLKNVPYPTLEAESMTPILRYLLCLKCLGPLHTQWAEVAHDPVLLLVSGLEAAPSPVVFAHLSSSATVTMNAWCQQWLLERLALQHHVEGRFVFAELVQISADDSILLLRDIRNDDWIFASYVAKDARTLLDALQRGITLLQKAVDIPIEYLLFGHGFGPLAWLDEFHDWYAQAVWTEPVPLPGMQTHHSDNGEGGHNITFWTITSQTLSPETQNLFARYLKHLRPAAGDLEYLSLNADGQPLMGNRDVDLTWSLVARALFRAFARHLVGFGQSSIDYLYHNFLAGASTVCLQQNQIEVQLACYPLHIILRMAGVNGQTYVLPWLNDTVVTLELPC